MSESGAKHPPTVRSVTGPTASRARLWPTIAGMVSATLGLMVLVGWHTHTVVLIQVRPTFVAMQYNTALCFLLSGVGLMSLAHGRTRLAVAMGIGPAVIGLMTLGQYVFGVELGIDQLFFEHYITVQASDPGRMAPNTALCFLLMGGVLVGGPRFTSKRARVFGLGAGGWLVLCLSTVALVGYATGATTAYGWGQLTRMAVHTSAGFVMLGSGLLAIAFMEGRAWTATPGQFDTLHPRRDRLRIVATTMTILTLFSAAVGVTVLRELYSTSLDAQREWLSELVRARILMIEAVSRFDGQYSRVDIPGGPGAATLRQLVDADGSDPGFGGSGEFTVARREGGEIIFLVRPPLAAPSFLDRVTLGSGRAEPMRLALEGKSGTIIGTDYRGERVVAAYAPALPLGLGIVAKVDLAELRQPFLRSAYLTLAISVLIIALGAGAIMLTVDPLLHRVLRQSETLRAAVNTLRRQASEREESVQALRQSESLLAGIYNTYPDLQFVLDPDGTILRYSSMDDSELYVPPQQFLGKRIEDVLPSTVAVQWGESMRVARAGQVPRPFEYSLQLSEEDRVFEARVGKLPGGGFIAVARDVTERRQAENDIHNLNRSLEDRVEQRTVELQDANQELEAFAYSVSHDLKAPLRAIDGYSAMLEESQAPSLDGEGRRLLGVVRENAKRMGNLIDDLLSLSRVGRAEMVPAEVNMKELAERTFLDLSEQEDGRTIDFSVTELPMLWGDVALLRQVWTNLLGNAVKFTGGRDPARIEVDCHPEPGYWVFSIRDNGAGFDMDYVDKMFRVFERLHYQEEFPGTGVGLAIAQRVLRRHGGSAWAEGEIDVGATIFFRLPRTTEGE